MCSALAAHRFPSSNLRILGPTAPYPLGSTVVIETAAVRSQFGSSLGSAYAPTVLASFGSGSARIDIRVIAPHGAAAYQTALGADLLTRKAVGQGLLAISQIATTATARRQLAAGQVDTRLMLVITALAAHDRIEIVDFGDAAPGASAGIPLRFADVAESDAAAHVRGAAYVRSMISLLRAQKGTLVPAHVGTVRLSGGQAVLRIEFAAPSPLGLGGPSTN